MFPGLGGLFRLGAGTGPGLNAGSPFVTVHDLNRWSCTGRNPGRPDLLLADWSCMVDRFWPATLGMVRVSMFGYRINRALQPVNIVIGLLGVSLASYIVFVTMSEAISAMSTLLSIAGASSLCYVCWVLTFLFSPYQLRITDDEVSFPTRVTSNTYRWWHTHLPSASIRYFASQQFEGSFSRAGFTGTLRFPQSESTVVEFSRDEIASVEIRKRGLSALEVTIERYHESSPFVCWAQAGVWPLSGRNRMADAIRNFAR